MRTPSRGVVPPGLAGLFLIAAAVAPVLIKKCKPAARKVADGLIKAGEKLKDATAEGIRTASEEPSKSVKDPEPSKPVAPKPQPSKKQAARPKTTQASSAKRSRPRKPKPRPE